MESGGRGGMVGGWEGGGGDLNLIRVCEDMGGVRILICPLGSELS